MPLILIKIIGPTRFLLHNKKQDNYVYVKNNAKKRLVLVEFFILFFFFYGFFLIFDCGAQVTWQQLKIW